MFDSNILGKSAVFAIKLIGYFCWKLSCVFPRDKSKWLLGDIMGFSGNTKYVLPELLGKCQYSGIRILWITHDKRLIPEIEKHGVRAYYWLDPVGIWHCATAGVYITTDCTKDINCYLSGKAYYVTLWHGIGLKGIGRLSKEYQSIPVHKRNSFYNRVMMFYWIFRTPDLCLTSSEFELRNVFMPMFGLSEDHFILGMYPRNKLLLMKRSEIDQYVRNSCSSSQVDLIKLTLKYERVYIYMPTYRGDGSDYIAASGINVGELNRVLQKRNALFMFKLHPKTVISLKNINANSNVVFVDKETDIYPVLPYTTALVTDYSSIYADYLLLNKEIIIFDFDKEEYISKDRDLLVDFDEYTKGCRAHTFSDLLRIIEEGWDCHLPTVDMDHMLNIYWSARNNDLDIFNEIRSRLNFDNSQFVKSKEKII